MPPNTQAVKFEMFEERIVKAMGELASYVREYLAAIYRLCSHYRLQKYCPDGTRLAGLLVRHDFQERLLIPSDLNMYTQLSTAVVLQQLHLPFHSSFERLVTVVGKLFEVSAIEVVQIPSSSGAKKSKSKKQKTAPVKKNKMKVYNTVSLTHTEPPG